MDRYGGASLTEIIDDLLGLADQDTVSVGEAIASLEKRGFGPLMLVPAIVAIIPIVGALPGVSIGAALIELLFAGQLAGGAKQPWLPARVRRTSIGGARLKSGLRAFRPWARRIEILTKPRLRFLTRGAAGHLSGTMALAIALMMLIGALVPGGIVPPAIAMIFLAVGLTTHDGLLVLLSYLVAAAATATAVWAFAG